LISDRAGAPALSPSVYSCASFAIGDQTLQEKCRRTCVEQRQTILFRSLSSQSVREMCSRVCVMRDERKVFDRIAGEGLAFYQCVAAGEAAS
jgi:ABC-type polysaccharide/polyol phosphate transport system ATPase subunit